ncbi:expressed unknown protein [Seminavis robusta]|uniref:F-box domain-containing protein n=1 Tax=Seminavis robusta TaxID=568900 RepID=A0A9N8DWS0_9STRA|nr:expressed unknown protein [Seminavis robusta]|eukprot:Sro339_g121070.1 n/a (468) ;mRNA; r:44210-45613
MASTCSPLFGLSTDAKNHVLGYLSLCDCLRYSQVSKLALVDVLPHLKQIRKEQFYERKGYRGCCVASFKDITVPSSVEPEVLLQPESHKGWHTLPSVKERLEGLYRALPSTHPSNDALRELVQDLKLELADATTTVSGPDVNFDTCLSFLKSVMKSHQLHDRILAKSTVRCEPTRADRGWATTHHAAVDHMNLTVTLDQYLGDVLVAYYLMGHSVAGLVEGPTNMKQWLRMVGVSTAQSARMVDPQGSNNDASSSLKAYRQWVFLHSTFLRTWPMTVQQLQHYKLTPICGITCRTDGMDLEYVQPPYCFVAEARQPMQGTHQSTTLFGQLEAIRVHQDPYSMSRQWGHQTIVNEFGPLGPAFRGRDRMRSLSLEPRDLVGYLYSESCTLARVSHDSIMPPSVDYQRRLHRWLSLGQDPAPDELLDAGEGPTITSWMMELPRQCYRTRPMTVHPPMVSIQRSVPLAWT